MPHGHSMIHHAIRLLAGCALLAFGTSCAQQKEMRKWWWGETRDDGTEAVVMGYQAPDSEYEPFLSVEVDPSWRSAPRERLEGSAHWTIQGVAPTEVRPDSMVATGIHSSEIYVTESNPDSALSSAHRQRARGKSVYLVKTEDLGARMRATLFGGDGWPMDWVRIAEFEWREPEAQWGLSNQTKEMFSSFASAAAFSTFCVR